VETPSELGTGFISLSFPFVLPPVPLSRANTVATAVTTAVTTRLRPCQVEQVGDASLRPFTQSGPMTLQASRLVENTTHIGGGLRGHTTTPRAAETPLSCFTRRLGRQ
jgi:hypothetical protein